MKQYGLYEDIIEIKEIQRRRKVMPKMINFWSYELWCEFYERAKGEKQKNSLTFIIVCTICM